MFYEDEIFNLIEVIDNTTYKKSAYTIYLNTSQLFDNMAFYNGFNEETTREAFDLSVLDDEDEPFIIEIKNKRVLTVDDGFKDVLNETINLLFEEVDIIDRIYYLDNINEGARAIELIKRAIRPEYIENVLKNVYVETEEFLYAVLNIINDKYFYDL